MCVLGRIPQDLSMDGRSAFGEGSHLPSLPGKMTLFYYPAARKVGLIWIVVILQI